MIYNSGKNIVLCVGPPVERPCQGDGGGGGGRGLQAVGEHHQ